MMCTSEEERAKGMKGKYANVSSTEKENVYEGKKQAQEG
jgi:hypothetical protein